MDPMESKSILKREGSLDTTRKNKSVRLSVDGTENVPGVSPAGKTQSFIQPEDMRERFRNLETSMRSLWRNTSDDAHAGMSRSDVHTEKSIFNMTMGLPPYLTNTNFGPCYVKLEESKPAHDFEVVPIKENKRMKFRSALRNYETRIDVYGNRPLVMVIGDADVRNVIEERLSAQMNALQISVNFRLDETTTAKELSRAVFLIVAVELDDPQSVMELDKLYSKLNSSSCLMANSCVLAFMSSLGKFGNTVHSEYFKEVLQKWQLHHYIIHKEEVDKTLEISKMNWRAWENLAMDISRSIGCMVNVSNLTLWGLRRPSFLYEEPL